MHFFKRKSTYIVLTILIIVSLFGYRQFAAKNAGPIYDTVTAEKKDLKQTVEVVGKIKAVDDLSLHFETQGTVGAVNVKEGDSIKAGTILAQLRLAELDAAVAQSLANLNLKLSPTTEQDKQFYAAAVDLASAAFSQARADADNTVSSAQSAVETAKANLNLAAGGENSQIVVQAYNDAVGSLYTILPKLDDALTQADNILGIDNILANADFKTILSATNAGKLIVANDNYLTAKIARNNARNAISPLTTASAHSTVDSALATTEDALTKLSALMTSVIDVLDATPGTSMDAKKTTILAARSNIASSYSTVLSQEKAVVNAKNSLITYQIAYNKALNDLTQAQADASASVASKNASFRQAVANYDAKINPPREVDVASYRAALSQAIANRNKAILTAPIDGLVSKINKKPGEVISTADIMIQYVSPHFEIDVDVPETDVVKIKLGQTADITFDSFGSDRHFSGTVIAIDPSSTEIQDVVYYRVRVIIDNPGQEIKFGMTANIVLGTAEKKLALAIPLRAVRTRADNSKYVRTIVNGQIVDNNVELGLKANDGMVEVLSGLNEGDTVVLGEKKL